MFPPKTKKSTPGAPKPGGLPDRAGLGAPSPVERKADPMPPDPEGGEAPAEEATESPEMEATEDAGSGDIMKDLAAVGEQYGADPDTSKALAADFLDALAKCLRGGKGDRPPMDVNESDTENYPA